MSAKPVVFHEQAYAEFEAAFDWYFERSQIAAEKFAKEIDDAIDTIAETPHRWIRHPHGTRKFPLHRFPFSIIYRELPSSIQVIAVAHGRRRPGYWKQRVRDPV